MTYPKIFVSYSHKDRKIFDELKEHLEPAIRSGQVSLWADTEIEIGSEWATDIHEAMDQADVAILLISKSFLASSFITDFEIPRLLHRQDASELVLVPVFVGRSLVKTTPFSFVAKSGELKQAKLIRWQGRNSPDEPLSALSPDQRDAFFVELIEQLQEMRPGRRPPHPTSPAPPPSPQSSDDPVDLTLSLDVLGDRLRIRYRSILGDAGPERTCDWATVQKNVLAPIHQALDGFKPDFLSNWLETQGLAKGQELFALLFGDAESWRPLFKSLFTGSAQPSPLFGKVRLRLVMTEPLLLSLPWRLLAYERRSLVAAGWTVATSPPGTPTAEPVTEPGLEIVILQAADAETHGLETQPWIDVLTAHWGEETRRDVRVIQTYGDVDHGPAPHLVIALAGPSSRDGSLIFEDGRLDLDGLTEVWSTPPCGVLLCCPGDQPLVAAAQALGRQVPLVMWPRLDDVTAGGDAMLRWLDHWLSRASEPAQALDHWPESSSNDTLQSPHLLGPQIATLGCLANYRQWTVRRRRRQRPTHDIRQHLDRVNPKSRVVYEVGQLIQDDDLRVTALITYAEEANGVAHASDQLRTFVETEMFDRIRLTSTSWHLPDVRRALSDYLTTEFVNQVGKLGEPPRQLLRRLGPKGHVPGRSSVLWFDWAIYGEHQLPPLKPSELEDWLIFCNDFLAKECPPELNIVCFIALEVHQDSHDRLQQILDQHHLDHRAHHFRFTPLPALSTVPPGELLQSLEKHTNCPNARCREATDLLLKETRGLFEPLVELIEGAEPDRWTSLLHSLRRRHAQPSQIDDAPF